MLAYIQCESVFNTGVLLQASYCWAWGCVITWVAYWGRRKEEHRTWRAEAAREFGVWISESLSFLETVYFFNIRPKVKGNNPCLFWFVCLKYSKKNRNKAKVKKERVISVKEQEPFWDYKRVYLLFKRKEATCILAGGIVYLLSLTKEVVIDFFINCFL